MAVLSINKDSFKKEVLDYQGLVLVDFYANWCGPCKIMTPIVDGVSNELSQIKFVKINVDENPELASQYQVFSIPTFLIFKNGEIVSQFVGVISKEKLLEELKKNIGE